MKNFILFLKLYSAGKKISDSKLWLKLFAVREQRFTKTKIVTSIYIKT